MFDIYFSEKYIFCNFCTLSEAEVCSKQDGSFGSAQDPNLLMKIYLGILIF